MASIATYMREVTLNFADEDISLWGGEGVWKFMSETADLSEPPAISVIAELSSEAGLVWDHSDLIQELCDTSTEMSEMDIVSDSHQCVIDPEHEEALIQWRNATHMDDLHSASVFTEWNQSIECVTFVGAEKMGGWGRVEDFSAADAPEFTPEMLIQRDTLNSVFNSKYGRALLIGLADNNPIWWNETDSIPNQTEILELTAVGANHGVAKSIFGAVFIPRGALEYLSRNGGAQIGTIFDGEMSFAPENKFPWRLTRDGVTFTYEDMCGNRPDDDY